MSPWVSGATEFREMQHAPCRSHQMCARAAKKTPMAAVRLALEAFVAALSQKSSRIN
jgi:hypothetical protein